MSITTIQAQFQTILATVTGIKTAPAEMPATLNNADLPLAWTTPRAGSWSVEYVGGKKQIRIYEIAVYVSPLGLDRLYEGGFSETLPILQAVGDALLDDPTLGDVVDTLQLKENELTDRGWEILTFLATGAKYHGFRMNVLAKETYT